MIGRRWRYVPAGASAVRHLAEQTTGEINDKNVFGHLTVKEGERRLMQACREVDGFEV